MSKRTLLQSNHQIGNCMLPCGICNRQLMEPKRLSYRHTFCKSCLLAAVSSLSSDINGFNPFNCSTYKQKISGIRTSEDIERLKCDFFELNFMNAMDNETNKNIHEKQSINYCVNQSEASARSNAAVNSLRNTKSDDLGEKTLLQNVLLILILIWLYVV